LEELFGHSIEGVWFLWQMQALFEGTTALDEQGIALGGALNDDQQRSAIQALVKYWWGKSNGGKDVTALEISARAVEFGYALGGDPEDLIAVLSGHVGDGLSGFFDQRASPLGPYNAYSLLPSTSGFGPTYADPDPKNNQVHHTWFWIQVAYYNADWKAYAGNWRHENMGDAGSSQQDYNAGLWGISMGHALQESNISLLHLAEATRTDLTK
jgi:hypothetical protein